MHTLPNLPAAVSRDVFATICASLPPPASDTPEYRAARDADAMAAVAALHPTDAFEARLAAEIVATDAHIMDCLRLAADFRNDLAATLRCRAQATSLMRQMRATLRELRRMQAERDKAEAAMHPTAMERAGWWFREATMPEPATVPEPAPEPTPMPVQPETPEPAGLSEAAQYAVIYPDRAARIRAARGLPARLDFGPPEPALVEALINGTSPILRALDPQRETATA